MSVRIMAKVPPSAAMKIRVKPLRIHDALVCIPMAMCAKLKIQTVAATHARCSVRLLGTRRPATVKPSAPENRFPI